MSREDVEEYHRDLTITLEKIKQKDAIIKIYLRDRTDRVSKNIQWAVNDYPYIKYARECDENKSAVLYVPTFKEYLDHLAKRNGLQSEDISSAMSKMSVH